MSFTFEIDEMTLEVLPAITLDFRGSMWDCRPRMLWQKLFDFYRESGCELGHLDNLLIDYENCKKLFDTPHVYYKKGTTHFIFGCESKQFMTTWISQTSWIYDSPKHTMLLSNYDSHLVCSVNADQAKLIPVIKKEQP